MSSDVQARSTSLPRYSDLATLQIVTTTTNRKDVEDVTKPQADTGAQLAPQESLTAARDKATQFMKDLDVPTEKAAELTKIIDSAIDERFGELSDLRIGRVIGSALATL